MHRIGHVLRHVVPARAAVLRHHDAAVVRGLLAVDVDTADVDHVRVSGRAVDDLVVPALADPGSRVGAETLGSPAGHRGIRARLLRERRRARHVLADVERRVDRAARADLQVHPRRRTHVRERELGPLGGAVREPVLDGREDPRPGRAGVGRAPDPGAVRARVDHVRVVRVDRHAADAAGRARLCSRDVLVAAGERRRAVVDPRPRGAAVRRLVEAPVRGADRRRGRSTGRGRDAAHRAGRGRVDRVRITLLDRDRADGAATELRLAQPRPRLAAVGRLVDADTRGGAACRVRLTGADVERVGGGVVRVERDRAHRVQLERAGQKLPLRLLVECVVRAPHTAACRDDPQPAVALHAGGRDRDGGHAAAGHVFARDVVRPRPERGERIEGAARTDAHPLSLLPGPRRERLALRGLPVRARVRDPRVRDAFGRIRAGEVLLFLPRGRGPQRRAVRSSPKAAEMCAERARELAATGRCGRGGARKRDRGHERRSREDRDPCDDERLTASACHPSPSLYVPTSTLPLRARCCDRFLEARLEPLDDLAVQALAGP